ncbi:MAG: zinc ABC transporter substrate-binding protein [Clostridia bacterium]|nr:zinc ABC transporter substrate-binding protein [Clostridia bacterium]
MSIRIKRFISVSLLLSVLCILLVPAGPASAEKALSVVTTIFPLYDWTRHVASGREQVDVTMLLDNGVDLHSYQPTAQDIMKIATCDVFIFVGGESDEWVSDALKEAVNPDMVVVNLLEHMGDDVKLEELVEGMESEEDDEYGGEEEADEHIWLSLRNAEKLTGVIAQALSAADPDSSSLYAENAAAYTGKLEALDAEYKEAIESAAFDTLLFGDRFPFRYLVDDYGLRYYAAFSGCSAETEASFQTIVFLAGKLDELKLPAVLTIEGTNHRIGETIVNATSSGSQKVLTLNSMQGTTLRDVEKGETYLSIMEENLQVLKDALN